MKTFKALFIDSGVIKAGEFPVEPEYLDYVQHRKYYWEVARREYTKALASAKANAVECEDQEEAKEIVAYELFNGPVVDVPLSRFNEKIIPLPSGWGYRVEERKIGGRSVKDKNGIAYDYETYTETVAKLYRTDEFEKFTTMDESPTVALDRTTQQPEPEETEDSIWAEILFNARWYDGTPHHLKSITECLKERFTITRRK